VLWAEKKRGVGQGRKKGGTGKRIGRGAKDRLPPQRRLIKG